MTTFSPESRAVLKTSMGDITIAFLVDKAPRTCEHFARLARQGFYDGLTFHRVIKDFIVQGGCPRGDGSGGPGFTLRAEFNDTAHVRGVVSMARGTDPHSAGSQFFIVQAEARYLDSRYTAFAKVVEGLDVVDKIASVPVGENRFRELSTPRDPVFINRIVLEGVEFDANDLAAGMPTATPGGGPGAGAPAGEGPGAAPMSSPPSAIGEEPDDVDDEGDDDGGAEGEADEPRGEAAQGTPAGGATAESERGDAERGESESEGDGEGEAEGGESPAPRGAGKTRSEAGGKNGGKNGGNGARRGGRRRRSRRGRSGGGSGGGGGGGGASG